MTSDPHRGQPILRRGPEPARARLAIICIHGRGASAEDILTVADELELDDVAYLAPQAAGNTWYPYSFLAPLTDNQPGLRASLTPTQQIISMNQTRNMVGSVVEM